jgi:hypothetical protein
MRQLPRKCRRLRAGAKLRQTVSKLRRRCARLVGIAISILPENRPQHRESWQTPVNFCWPRLPPCLQMAGNSTGLLQFRTSLRVSETEIGKTGAETGALNEPVWVQLTPVCASKTWATGPNPRKYRRCAPFLRCFPNPRKYRRFPHTGNPRRRDRTAWLSISDHYCPVKREG